MGWQDLLSKTEMITVPWTGGRSICLRGRTWTLEGRIPLEHGWHRFNIDGSRKATWAGAGESAPDFDEKRKKARGYLVGDRLIPDGTSLVMDPAKIIEQSLDVHLIEEGMERFARAMVVQHEDGKWIFIRQEFPLGPEGDVAFAYQDRKQTVNDIPGVTPALDLAFRWETWRRDQTEAHRQEIERQRQEEERRQRLIGMIGTGEGRRQLAAMDFGEAAKAALRVSGAELLDHRPSTTHGEMVVQYRFEGRRYECVVETNTLRVVDSGICLTDHGTGERGDTRFTLESLPTVILQAIREHRLVVYRHADGRGNNRPEDDNEDEDW